MKKLFSVSLILVVFTFIVQAQEELIIQSSSKGFYLNHKVTPKENFYSIGRLFHTHPRSIASFNNLDMSKGLSLGQVIRIPLTDTNFTQEGNTGVPVHYIVNGNEGLAEISNKNNNVQLSSLRNWNNLSGTNPPGGRKLIIGFLVTNEMRDRVVTLTPEKKNEIIAPPPVTEKKQETVEEKKDITPEVKQETGKKEPVVVKQEEKTTLSTLGYFKSHFDQQVKQTPVTREQTLTSGIFKTASGWQDAKYYMLMDKVEPGTIVKITNPGNNKVVFAKVLYGMEGVRQNQGLDMRISNAAASALEITEQDKFILRVNY